MTTSAAPVLPRLAGLAVGAVLAAVLLPGLVAPRANAATASRGTAAELLARLPAAAEHTSGYARSLFVIWIDADHDGCDTREEVLITESRTTATTGSGCSVHGSWRSAYDGVTTTSASRFDIDHVVPLKEAWDSGAWRWTAATRQAYANDLADSRTLRAVSAASNRSKGDKDPAQWLPPLASFRCTYASDWVAVKTRWHLTVDSAERTALKRIIAGCPAKAIAVTLATVHTTSSGSTTNPAPTPGSGSSCNPNYAGYCVPNVPYDLNCADIGHRVTVVGVDVYRLDGDGDGIGCESYG